MFWVGAESVRSVAAPSAAAEAVQAKKDSRSVT